MGRMVEVAPKPNATAVVKVVRRMLCPTAFMVFSTRSTGSPEWPVRKYAPVMMNVSSRPMPKMTKMIRFVMSVMGTPTCW